jgi:hypothetical protein
MRLLIFGYMTDVAVKILKYLRWITVLVYVPPTVSIYTRIAALHHMPYSTHNALLCPQVPPATDISRSIAPALTHCGELSLGLRMANTDNRSCGRRTRRA